MVFFDIFKFKDINGELEKAKTIQGSVILALIYQLMK